MRNLKIITAFAILLTVSTVNAQKWTQGKDLSYLKGEKELLLKFSYDNVKVGSKAESDYVNEKKDEYNKKESGKGDKFAKSWEGNKTGIYEPKFEELFNKVCGEDLACDRSKSGAKYTMLLKVIRMEPGFNIGIMKKAAASDFEITILETANPSAIKSKGMLYNVPGSQMSGYDFDVASRLQECFAKCGKTLGKKMGKACKSK